MDQADEGRGVYPAGRVLVLREREFQILGGQPAVAVGVQDVEELLEEGPAVSGESLAAVGSAGEDDGPPASKAGEEDAAAPKGAAGAA
jgi:hypothetical protein